MTLQRIAGWAALAWLLLGAPSVISLALGVIGSLLALAALPWLGVVMLRRRKLSR